MERRQRETAFLGILFTGGDGPEPETVRRLVGSPACSAGGGALVVAADSGLALAEAAGVDPYRIIGDMDSPGTEERLLRHEAEKIIRYNTDKDYTDTELAFDFLRENGCGDIWIIGGGGGRIDHLFGIRDLFERDCFPRRWVTAAEDIRCVDAAQGASVLEECAERGSLVSVFPLGDGPWKAESRGLQWSLNDVRWKRGLYGLSNVAVADEIAIHVVRGRFMVIFPWGERGCNGGCY